MDPFQNPQQQPAGPAPTPTVGQKNKMKLMMLIVAGVVGVALIGLLVWWFAFRDSSSTNPLETPAATITINESGFTPDTVTIKQGQAVRWVNEDQAEHQVGAEESVLPDLNTIDVLGTGETYTFPFDEKGTYPYFDPLNPEQYHGTVIVE